MTKRELEILNCECRIELLISRPRENRRIVAKLERKLRQLMKKN